MIATGKTYTEAFSGGVVSGGSGNFSSSACVMTSESGTHFSSSFISGTLPSGLIFKNLDKLLYKELRLLKNAQLENNSTKLSPYVATTNLGIRMSKTNHSGLFLKSTYFMSYGRFFSSKVSKTLCVNGPKWEGGEKGSNVTPKFQFKMLFFY